jgi:hypothetical protein
MAHEIGSDRSEIGSSDGYQAGCGDGRQPSVAEHAISSPEFCTHDCGGERFAPRRIAQGLHDRHGQSSPSW